MSKSVSSDQSASPAPRSYFARVSLVVILVGVALLAYVLNQSRSGFPIIAAGVYTGTATGLGVIPTEEVQVYVESDGEGFLWMVVFDEGWKPQSVTIKKKLVSSVGPGAEPVTLHYGEQQFSLSGRRDGAIYVGEVVGSDGTHGHWELHKLHMVDRSTIHAVPHGEEFSLSRWLSAKRRHEELRLELQELAKLLDVEENKRQRLQDILHQEVGLKERAEKRKEQLVEEVQEAFREREQAALELDDLVRELEMMERITSRGRLVLAARRVAERENRWVLANWGARSSRSTYEELLGDSLAVDVDDLESAIRRAAEVRRLQAQIDREKTRIKELEDEYNRRLRSVQPDRSPRKRRRNFWDKVFG